MADQDPNRIYGYPNDQEPDYARDKTTERPHHWITLRIRLNPNNLPDERSMETMIKELKEENMNQVNRNTNIITVSGIPPDHGFDAQEVLEIVQKYSPGAQSESMKD